MHHNAYLLNMEYFRSITLPELVKIIESARSNLLISLPAIHTEIAKAIEELADRGVFKVQNPKFQVLIDFHADTIRQGYGDTDGYIRILKTPVLTKSLPGNRISFIIADDLGYFLFFESRSLISLDYPTMNAVMIDPVSLVRIKHHFFNLYDSGELENELADAVVIESKKLENASTMLSESTANASEITDSMFDNVKKDLDQNPPLLPDMKRMVEFYSTKFQYAELHFEGQNIMHLSVNIPSSALPYNDENLKKRLKTKIKVFESMEISDTYKSFDEIIEFKKAISAKYLTSIKCRRNKNLLKKVEKVEFLRDVQLLRAVLDQLKSSYYQLLDTHIKSARKELKFTLETFLLDNPSEEMKVFGEPNFNLTASNIAEGLIRKIRFPDPAKLIKEFQITTTFSDLTYEDIKDQTFINELKKRNLITEMDEKQIAHFETGYRIQEN